MDKKVITQLLKVAAFGVSFCGNAYARDLPQGCAFMSPLGAWNVGQYRVVVPDMPTYEELDRTGSWAGTEGTLQLSPAQALNLAAQKLDEHPEIDRNAYLVYSIQLTLATTEWGNIDISGWYYTVHFFQTDSDGRGRNEGISPIVSVLLDGTAKDIKLVERSNFYGLSALPDFPKKNPLPQREQSQGRADAEVCDGDDIPRIPMSRLGERWFAPKLTWEELSKRPQFDSATAASPPISPGQALNLARQELAEWPAIDKAGFNPRPSKSIHLFCDWKGPTENAEAYWYYIVTFHSERVREKIKYVDGKRMDNTKLASAKEVKEVRLSDIVRFVVLLDGTVLPNHLLAK